jgi:hypothetical protein
MKSKWKTIVSNPLGKETYDMTIDTVDNLIQAHIVNEKGSATLTQLDSDGPLILSTLVDVPMSTKVDLKFLTDDYLNKQSFNAVLSIGQFATMSVECVKYE